MKPNVYFKSILNPADRKDSLVRILDRLRAELGGFKPGEIVGIKTTIGDNKNTAYIKPELIRLFVDRLTAWEVKTFVFDTNVLYRGMRMNAVDHLNLAYRKGFVPRELGCPFIIADGVFGTDSRAIEINPVRKKSRNGMSLSNGVNRKNLKEIRVPSLISVLENLVVFSHITGHMLTGYAASIKNVGMGMASRAGKQIQHSSVKPNIIKNKCTLCGCCIDICPAGAISKKQDKAFINSSLCLGCGECIAACKFNAVSINWREDNDVFVERITEYAWGILSKIKRKIFLNFAFDITKECDCLSGSDPKIIKDVGIFASSDILAVDKACFDVVIERGGDVFSQHQNIRTHLHQFAYAQEIGLGSLEYELVKL